MYYFDYFFLLEGQMSSMKLVSAIVAPSSIHTPAATQAPVWSGGRNVVTRAPPTSAPVVTQAPVRPRGRKVVTNAPPTTKKPTTAASAGAQDPNVVCPRLMEVFSCNSNWVRETCPTYC